MRRSANTIRRKVGALMLLLSPCLVWGQPSPSPLTIFGKPTNTWVKPTLPIPPWRPAWTPPTEPTGIPLTCANASAAIAQWNSGISPATAPGMQAGIGWDDTYATVARYTPDWALLMEGLSAQWVPSSTTRNWALPPGNSKWIYVALDGDPNPILEIAYVVAIYIPTAEDAARMQVNMEYRAHTELRGIYRNEFPTSNLLPQPITTDTSTPGTATQTIALNSGWRQGDNYLTIVVRGEQPDVSTIRTGFAAQFTAGCATPQVTAVPTLDSTALAAMALSLLGLGVYARRRRKTGEH